LKIHIDWGFFCWQLISIVQQNGEHDEDGNVAEVIDVESSHPLGFQANEIEDE
jgi:hypothetical protein